MDFHKYNIASANERERYDYFFLLLASMLVISIVTTYFHKPFLPKQIQICDAIQCSSIYTLWAQNWCVCIWCGVYECIFLVTHSICSLDWVACMVFGRFFAHFLSLSFFFVFFINALCSLSLLPSLPIALHRPFHFAIHQCDNSLCSTIVNMIKVKQPHNHFLTILKQLC